jgi:hypothetical protein
MNPMVGYSKVVTSFRNFRSATRCWRTCPNCNQQIDIQLALRLSGWSKLASPKFGIRCPNCKKILAARQQGGIAAFWIVFAVVFAMEMLGIVTGHLARAGMFLSTLGLGVFAVFMQRWRLRSLIELSLPPPGVELREMLPSAREYAYLEGKSGPTKAFQFDPATTEEPGPEWICSKCRQPNPASFDLCWKCNHQRAAPMT